MDYSILFNFQQYFRYVMAVNFFLIEEREVHRINHSQTLLHKVVSSTPCAER
jgi:hypothetical protein